VTTPTKYSIAAASRLTGKSRTTIAKHVRSGRLSCVEDASGAKLIDASELVRVYGDDLDFSQPGAEEAPEAGEGARPPPAGMEAALLEQRLTSEASERERERQQYRAQIEHLQEALKLAQEGHNRATLLLENRGAGGGEWQVAIKQLEEKIANQETQSRQELQRLREAAKRQIDKYKQALEAAQSRSLWQRLFG
jgi:hypothetical protein